MSIVPADSPKRMILAGSPPKEEMYLRTHVMAFSWSLGLDKRRIKKKEK